MLRYISKFTEFLKKYQVLGYISKFTDFYKKYQVLRYISKFTEVLKKYQVLRYISKFFATLAARYKPKNENSLHLINFNNLSEHGVLAFTGVWGPQRLNFFSFWMPYGSHFRGCFGEFKGLVYWNFTLHLTLLNFTLL